MKYFLKTGFTSVMAFILVLLISSLCFALGGKVTYPDGTPAVGAKVSLVGEKGAKEIAICDARGQFQFAQLPSDNAEIQIKARDGKDYAPVVLPAAVFVSGETAIVLQPKGK